uniref:Protein DGCR14 n=1 Tax=Manihot esculenta TaxID=3983 RepID=A0A2C9UU67_MANES
MDVTPKTSTKPLIHFLPLSRKRLSNARSLTSSLAPSIFNAQLKIIERRVERVNNSTADGNTQTRSQKQTPCSTFMRNFTPFDEFDNKTAIAANMEFSGNEESGEHEVAVDDSMSLDDFFRRYTSEDNDSFSKILEKENRKRKERYGHLLEGEKLDEKLSGDAKRNRSTDGYGTSDQPPSTLEGWNYTAKNFLMCGPSERSEAPLTEEERAVRLKGLTKEINRSNTRFHGKMLDSRPDDDGTLEVLYTPIVGATPLPVLDRDEDKAKKYDLEDLRKTPNMFYVESGQKAENGYSFVRTPSPAPGVDESPFITWGEIEGTPLRLEPEDTPIDVGGSSDGPHFKIPNLPARDMKAHSLSREVARKLRERSKMFQKPPLPSPASGGSASPSVRILSPAAQKFMRDAISKCSSSIGTPKSGRSVSRFGRDGSMSFGSPSVREDFNPL